MSKPVHPVLLAIVAIGLLLGPYALLRWMQSRVLTFQSHLDSLLKVKEQSALALDHFQALADLETQDVNQFKAGMSDLAVFKKTLYETGLSVQEEKRLLEKQLEIMMTYLTVNTPLQRIFLMRGDQPLESYLIDYVPVKVFGGLTPVAPRAVRIISKERFAHPERGSAEMINGKLQWQPPQVGTSVRSNALGEYVLFTNSQLILHGPPRNPIDHEAFPHLCLGLSLEAARNLYRHSFIGSRIMLNREAVRSAIPPVSVQVDTAAVESRGD